jgi:hypothetical protein
MEQQSPEPTPEKQSWFTRKIYETDAEKKKDFWLGVGIFFGLNILLGICSFAATMSLFGIIDPITGADIGPANYDLYTTLNCILSLLPWILNIGLIIYFAFTRSQIALGMVAGFGIALAIVICLGTIFLVWCFVSLSGGGF